MSLSPDDAARLATLRSVRDKIIMGQSVVKATYNGFETDFRQGDLARIEAEIEKLERQSAGKPAGRRGAVGFRY